ncbi:MAG TPA: putative metal-binding motif-containing protein [Polyangiaceae bacterium]
MRAATLLRAALASSGALLASCSLMGLGEFDIGECTNDDQCQSLNDAEGIDETDCMAYQCRKDKTGCELRKRDLDGDGVYAAACADGGPVDCDDQDGNRSPELDEECDGVDNDCDLVIDEGLSAGNGDELITFTGANARVYFSKAAGDLSVSVGNGSASVEAIDIRQSPWEASALAYRSEIEQDKEVSTEEGIDKRKCPRLGSPDLTSCNFTEAVAASSGGDFIVAAIDTEGCNDGLLRIGHLEGRELVLRRPPEHSNIAYGVDSDGKCTGASRASGTLGVARPAIAARQPEGDYPQALVGFIAAPQDSDACAGASTDVEVLGIFRESIRNNPKIRWTSGTNDGVPQVIGQSAGGGRPVVLATDTEDGPGYLVAYGAAGGGLALHFVEEFPFRDHNNEYVLATPHTTEIRATAPLEIGAPRVLFEDRDIDHVALLEVGADDDGLRLGFAWIEDACSSGRTLHFAEAGYEDGEFRADEPLTITKLSSPPTAAPTLSYVEQGFVMPGYESPETGDRATATNNGGFVIAWADDGVLYARRILDLDQRLLDEQPLQVHQGEGLLTPLLFQAAEQTRFAVFDHESSKLQAGEVSCTQ